MGELTRYPMKEDPVERVVDLYRYFAAHYGDKQPGEAYLILCADVQFMLAVMDRAAEQEAL